MNICKKLFQITICILLCAVSGCFSVPEGNAPALIVPPAAEKTLLNDEYAAEYWAAVLPPLLGKHIPPGSKIAFCCTDSRREELLNSFIDDAFSSCRLSRSVPPCDYALLSSGSEDEWTVELLYKDKTLCRRIVSVRSPREKKH